MVRGEIPRPHPTPTSCGRPWACNTRPGTGGRKLTGMDEDTPQPGTQDKIMAVVGLAVGIVLIAISIDLLRPAKQEAAAGDDGV